MPLIFRVEGYAFYSTESYLRAPVHVRQDAAVAKFCLDSELSAGIGDLPRHLAIAA